MTWVRIDDHFDQNPKLAQAGPLGWALWMAGLAYCNRTLTDGFIPRNVAHSLMGLDHIDREGRAWKVCVTSGMTGDDVTCESIASWLVDAELWDVVAGGYQVHDYLEFQPSREDVLRERDRNRSRQERFNEKRRIINEGTNDRTNGGTNAGYNGVITAGITPAPVPGPVPGPVTPDPDPEPVRGGDGADAPPHTGRGKSTRKTFLDDEYVETLVTEFAPRSGGEANVRESVAAALGHKNRSRWNDLRLYVRGWVRRDADRWEKDHGSRTQSNHTGAPGHHPAPAGGGRFARYNDGGAFLPGVP